MELSQAYSNLKNPGVLPPFIRVTQELTRCVGCAELTLGSSATSDGIRNTQLGFKVQGIAWPLWVICLEVNLPAHLQGTHRTGGNSWTGY